MTKMAPKWNFGMFFGLATQIFIVCIIVFNLNSTNFVEIEIVYSNNYTISKFPKGNI